MPARLCGDNCFVEGIVVDDLHPEHIERLLADRDTWREMLRANAKQIAGSATDEQQGETRARIAGDPHEQWRLAVHAPHL